MSYGFMAPCGVVVKGHEENGLVYYDCPLYAKGMGTPVGCNGIDLCIDCIENNKEDF